jgi:hypothetical protein
MDIKAWLHERLSLGKHEQVPELSDESWDVLTRVAEASIEEEKQNSWLVGHSSHEENILSMF